MHAHISWANKDFSKTYCKLLGQIIVSASHYDTLLKFKTPLIQVLLLEDSKALMSQRAKIAMKSLFFQKFKRNYNEYYTLGLEVTQLILYLAKNVKSFHEDLKKYQDLIYPYILEFLEKDPMVSLTQMQWTPHIPRNVISLDLQRRLITEEIEDCIKITLMYQKELLSQLVTEDPSSTNTFTYMKIEDTMSRINYTKGSDLYFFAEKYKDWISAKVNQNVGEDVVYIETDSSYKEKTSPIFVFREVLESLDDRIFGESEHEIDSFGYFHRFYKMILSEA